ncbi:uncharacterized protein OCT59_013982 [Rhizophagus irregularis]|uniref:Uncharacterized protein n=3 Tax=Rhizophagus irregularis TaxID=588596 RepID=A0A015IHE2_RHIIW|nr:hypothetical protein GLOIN_2v1764041 [Rhizophagus irregularis DAOM 181602=DAOM 197198]EXX53480.1 hypothetical protein RirG_243480 [Rhizophagus irregularis DAOM 197198w]POG80792.1 hypothetical protein GLOIN_2v1764041 [Rhizophagus irregularis DAOM 181602=DAOM 197198]UZO21595.1 hypothetical protein OCT59_013982 [Rhizophagus irregularis]GET58891.1 hypothetical protein GLOIN_2v1764041 [Rhizophagus irregularis DAOM 181602=DAOM 197198]|eukprot:XP_025187658.1 hypothetical protein GLOIN_2v1764041 [Rhizophagus irregularis DAOM 181602=DAOM 197198]
MVKEEKERLQRVNDQPELDRKQKLASELGTSSKRADQRQLQSKLLTSFTDEYHGRFRSLCRRCKMHMAPTSAENDPVREQLLKFSLNFNDTVKKYYDNPDNLYEIIYSDTSEETRAIERKPHKRSTLINANLNIHK